MQRCKSFWLSLVTVWTLGLSHSVLAEQLTTNPPPVSLQEDSRIALLKKNTEKPVVALVLGSGGARGYAHIGVLEALEQQGVKPDFIVGTSAGSIVGALYASGKTAEQLHQIALDLRVNDVRDFKVGKQGFFDGKKVEEYINKLVDGQSLESLKIPMYVVATQLKSGEKVIFNQGNTGLAVRASVTIPSMFAPTLIAGKEYVDGGLVSPVPVNIARDLGADVVIAVDILAQPKYTETTNMWGLFNQNINIMQNTLAAEELKNADVVIQPDLREKLHIFDMKGRETTMHAGEIATQLKMKQIKVVLQRNANLNASQEQ
ncbi:patatin-like phospholipase family protein [Acinetobacter rudis]|uniref:NTE family protein n=1 Tax=Acinetobacter rudis CIP 110305 TaxID=421052 RepID=S3NW46_9GAMM|nr:patatin-like phospholipase family protein [Acinetobacter rudis]EPF70856.1 NTE family protein [Acinetobacter rudis CIP 110305]